MLTKFFVYSPLFLDYQSARGRLWPFTILTISLYQPNIGLPKVAGSIPSSSIFFSFLFLHAELIFFYW